MTDDQAAHDDAAKAGAHDQHRRGCRAEAFAGSLTGAFATVVRSAVAEPATTGLLGMTLWHLPGVEQNGIGREHNGWRRRDE